MNKTIKILDIEVPKNKVVQKTIAEEAGISNGYLTELIQGKKKHPAALRKVRKAIINLYSNVITYNTTVSKDTNLKSKSTLKKSA